MRTALMCADIAVFNQDTDLRFTWMFKPQLGYQPEDVVGKTDFDLLPEEAAPRVAAVKRRVLETGVGAKEEVLIKHEGKRIYFDLIVEPVMDENGKAAGLVGATIDISERKKAEEEKIKLEAQLRQVQKLEAIGTLAGGIAHDFNNILTSIIGYTELAKTGVPEGNQLRKHLDQVLKSGFRAKDLVMQILTFSRQTVQERRPMQIAPAVKEALKLLRSSLPSTIEIRQEIAHSPSGGIVLADPTQIHQVLMNLCANAAHAMRLKGGVLSVHLSEVDVGLASRNPDLRPGHYLKLTVTDTGHGMDAAVLERIFDPYFTTKGIGEGTGLGLSVVQGIIKNHGGAITVYSVPGRGTTFHVFLPTVEENLAAEAKIQELLPTGSERILFVDDEISLVDLGEETLVSLGYNVTAKTSSLEALDIFRAEPDAFDLVITDMTMPDFTGAALAERLRAIRKDVPIILCSGFSELINANQARELGIREFVTKPYTITTLAKAVRKALEQN